MINKHFKRCSTSVAIRKIQIKTTMRQKYTPIRIASKTKQTLLRAHKDEEQLELS